MTPEIVIERERIEYVLDAFGYDVNDDGFIVDSDTRTPVESTSGNPIRKNELGMAGNGSVDFVEDDISALTSYLRDQT